MDLRTDVSDIPWNRWTEAQAYEQAFWERLGHEMAAGTRDLNWYAWRAGQLRRRLADASGVEPPKGKVLEIGSGPVGIVNFLDAGERYALDPLEHFYRTQPSLVALRRPGVTYLDGTGERLPFADASCSLVIIDNVIDHTYAPRKILDEIRRVLEPDGHLYLSVNVHTAWGAHLHGILAALRIDKGHPYTFTSRTLRQILTASAFCVLTEHVDDYGQAKRTDCQSANLKDRIKGYSGLSEFSHSVVCRRDSEGLSA
jgi:ubiquinone/menaquinone biosynthesis C-methylase UbiE